ncbi:hypothetical protein L6452_31114 [Arctium lappa]|uniref:Uncharacterized protein n=1 Tax=Arctium lappa TaxID=4217 RepID=A0ACB8ZPE4_ARCLA|nr:hypothetical protein L6452_31114 [Arctium lappa]
MASMAFIDEHNEIAMLQKPKQAEGFHQIVDFLKSSHIAHALTVAPTIYIEHQRQFWANATIVAENGVQMIKTRICDQSLTVTEEVIRISLRLDDASGITSIPYDELFSTLSKMGYQGQMGIFKFFKAKFSPQWRFFAHTLMHCISKKTTGWSQFSSPIAYALVCLSTTRKFNFSQMIFHDLVSNLDNKKSFFMYPRFVQEVINHELTDIPQPVGVYVPKPPKGKVFSNMRRSAGDSEGVDTPLFSTMMVVSQTTEGMAAGSRPPLDHPTASQAQPSHSKTIPQSLLAKPTSPITHTYKRKQVKKAPSLLVPESPKPISPLRENSPLENIHRETTGVSPNPKEVLSEEEVEHMGDEADTTPASTEEESGNINKTSPMATLNEQSFEGPWCQETKGVDSASARQKTSTSKRSNDPSIGGNTPGEGEDRYNYEELMETMGNINQDVIKQGKEIEELKLVILSQQVQITKLKKLVMKLVQKQKRKQFVLRRRKFEKDAPKKGEINMEEATREGELEKEKVEVEGEREAEKESVSGQLEAVTDNAAETSQAAVTELSPTEVEVAETLIKAKNDTPKAKGVIINEGGAKKREKKEMDAEAKNKGKAKMVESDQPVKKQKLVESDEALARKMQEEMEKEERAQVEKDREMAKALAAELNKTYQKGLETEKAKQRAISLRKAMIAKSSAKKRRPSQTYLATQERNKMITFLRSAIGVKKEMFVKMNFDQIRDLYEKEMGKLKSNEKDRVEFEKKAKESNDIDMNQPFPESEEGTPIKEMAEKKEEKNKEETLVQVQKILKRTKMMAKRKKNKKPRVVEEQKVAEEEVAPESSNQQESSTKNDVSLYMVVMDKVPEPISAEPVGVKPPEVIHWDILTVDEKEYIRLKRKDDQYEVFNTWVKIVRTCSRSDIEEMFDIGMKLYADQLKAPGISLTKLVMEYLCMMFKPEEVDQVIRNVFQAVTNWTLYETSGVYAVTLDRNHTEYFLVDRLYNHSRLKIHAMLKKKLGCTPNSEMAKYLIQRIINQSLGLNPDIGA